MSKMLFGPALETKPPPVQTSITVAGQPALELTYEVNGHSFTELSIINGDHYLQVQSDTPGGPPSSGFQDEIRDVLKSLTIAES